MVVISTGSIRQMKARFPGVQFLGSTSKFKIECKSCRWVFTSSIIHSCKGSRCSCAVTVSRPLRCLNVLKQRHLYHILVISPLSCISILFSLFFLFSKLSLRFRHLTTLLYRASVSRRNVFEWWVNQLRTSSSVPLNTLTVNSLRI